MKYAKVNDVSGLLKYPYTYQDLQNENPYTNFGDSDNIIELYSKTEDSVNSGNYLTEVVVSDLPELSKNSYANLAANPIKKNGLWVLEYLIQEIPEEQIHSRMIRKYNTLLQLTAYTQDETKNQEMSAEMINAWAQYRSSITDILNSEIWPETDPVPPEPLPEVIGGNI